MLDTFKCKRCKIKLSPRTEVNGEFCQDCYRETSKSNYDSHTSKEEEFEVRVRDNNITLEISKNIGKKHMENKPTIREDWMKLDPNILQNLTTGETDMKAIADYWLNKIKEVVGETVDHIEMFTGSSEQYIHRGMNWERQRILKEFGIIK